MIVPTNMSKRVILVCKGHHSQDNTLDALVDLVAKQCALTPEQVSNRSILHFLTEALLETGGPFRFSRLIIDAYRYQEAVSITDMMWKLIGEISVLQVRTGDSTLIDLALADSN